MMAAPGIGVHRQSSKASSRIEFRPPKPQNEYLWVNFEGPNQRFKAKIGRTQSFIASKSHRLRKAKQLQNLRDSIQPLPTHRDELYPADRKEESNDSSESNGDLTRSVVCRAVGIGVQAAFPIFSVSTNASLDFYFQYCMYWLNLYHEAEYSVTFTPRGSYFVNTYHRSSSYLQNVFPTLLCSYDDAMHSNINGSASNNTGSSCKCRVNASCKCRPWQCFCSRNEEPLGAGSFSIKGSNHQVITRSNWGRLWVR